LAVRVEDGDRDHAKQQSDHDLDQFGDTARGTTLRIQEAIRAGKLRPDCDLANRALNGECGALANPNFGGLNVDRRGMPTTHCSATARAATTGISRAELQHQLRPGVSMSGGYYRNWFGNFLGTDNTLVTRRISIRSASRRRRIRVCQTAAGIRSAALYDVNPLKFGQVNSVITQADNYGKLHASTISST
jgi:hypothetical protein